jgi:hypothetical protein
MGSRTGSWRGKRTQSAPCLRDDHFAGTERRRSAPLVSGDQSSPLSGSKSVEIPETEARRARLYTPAWVIVDEFNTDDLRDSFAVESRQPLGVFSRKFMARIAAEAASAIRAGGARAVPRR